MSTNRKVILYIAMSLDGYIAKSNDDIGFLSLVEKPGEDYGYFKFIISVIPILLGDGIPLFKSGRPEGKLNLINAVHFEKGLVQLHYERDSIVPDLK